MAHIKEFEHLKIPLQAITSATNNFSDESCIGKGGFGKVYKGEITHSEGHTMAALKRLNPEFGQGDPEFWKEIMMLSRYKHENIVSLLGYCDDYGEKILVYEYAAKSSLERYLKSRELTWIGRLNICIGAARGLAYLHSAPIGTQQRVLHRDIKSSNILIDRNWNAKISDFGLSKFGPANQEYTFLVSHPVGTYGYCDPLYVETGSLTKESDVYSFGVVLFEVLCGRLSFSNNNDERKPLVGLVRQCYEQNELNQIIYGNISNEINPDSLKMFSAIAYQCLNRKREDRPLMSEVVRSLETALECQVFIKDEEVANMSLLLKSPQVNILDRDKALENPAGIKEYAHEGGGFLLVTIHEGKDFEERYPFIHVMLGFDIRRTTTAESKNPVWKEEFKFTLKKPPTNDKLHLTIGSSSWRDKYLYMMEKGHIEISLEEVVREKHTNKIYHYRKCQIRVELQWEPSSLPLETKSKVVQLLNSFYNVDVKKVRGK